MPEQITRDGFSSLNLISLLGLVTMIGFAWLMSSYRTRVNWRLVVFGVGFQLVLGAVFFNSQTWTFDHRFASFEDLYRAVQNKSISTQQVDAALSREKSTIAVDAKTFESFSDVQTAIEEHELTVESVAALYPKGALDVPRFQGGILFYAFNNLFGYIMKWTAEGASFVFAPMDLPITIRPIRFIC